MANVVYEIAKWKEVFENSESKRIKTLAWVALPVNPNSAGYNHMLDTFGDEACLIYGAWCSLVSYAATMPVRGKLATSQGRSITWHNVARWSGFPASVYERLAEWASRDDVRWLLVTQTEEGNEVGQSPDDSRATPENPPEDARGNVGLPDRTGQGIELHNRTGPDTRARGPERTGSGFFARLEEETLRNTPDLHAWYILGTKTTNPITGKPYIEPSEEHELGIIALAEHALEMGDKPIALFVSNVQQGLWSRPSCTQADRAAERLKLFKAGQCSYSRTAYSPPGMIKTAAESIGPLPDTKQLQANVLDTLRKLEQEQVTKAEPQAAA